MRKSRVYIVLLHYPMYNKRMDIITTSITNLDLHDISRVARTYNADGFFVVHPSENQRELLEQIKSYWQEGYGGTYNPDRKEAFKILRTAGKLAEVKDIIARESPGEVLTVATDARPYSNSVSYLSLREKVLNNEQNILLLFGTGWGIQKELLEECDYILAPLAGGGAYNHLSVRSAVSIILDRLLGESWFQT